VIIALDKIAVGDRLRVRPGESVPVEGVVLDGQGSARESMVPREPIPVEKQAGDSVIGGDSMLSRIVQMVAEAKRSRATKLQ
jgi:Cu+-exporting ATPase